MQHNWYTLIGMAAAILTTVAYFPQALQIIRTRHTKDVSLGMYIIMTSGILCWLTYGILIFNWPIITANAVSLLLTSTILVMKLKYK